jgi:hypothetical protein
LTDEQRNQALKAFRWLKLESGFPRPLAGRG